MKCPFCRETVTEVFNSRDTRSSNQIWRRRRCKSCKEPFTTYEAIDLGFINIQKRNGKIEAYSKAKLYSSIYSSLSGTDFDQNVVDAITDTIENKMLDKKTNTVKADDLAYITLITLRHFNTAGFLRYLSLQTQLTNNSELKKELKKYS